MQTLFLIIEFRNGVWKKVHHQALSIEEHNLEFNKFKTRSYLADNGEVVDIHRGYLQIDDNGKDLPIVIYNHDNVPCTLGY